jgi:5-methylcytosine-specific restriction protein A
MGVPPKRSSSRDHRPSARRRGYDSKWEKESKAFLALPENRLCICGCCQPSEMVDHKEPHRGDKRLFWSRANWQAMTKRCHSRKTAAFDGGFGNRSKDGSLPVMGCDADGRPRDPNHPWNAPRA